jgi:hypothetical protein
VRPPSRPAKGCARRVPPRRHRPELEDTRQRRRVRSTARATRLGTMLPVTAPYHFCFRSRSATLWVSPLRCEPPPLSYKPTSARPAEADQCGLAAHCRKAAERTAPDRRRATALARAAFACRASSSSHSERSLRHPTHIRMKRRSRDWGAVERRLRKSPSPKAIRRISPPHSDASLAYRCAPIGSASPRRIAMSRTNSAILCKRFFLELL